MFKKINLLILAFIVSVSLLPAKAIKVAAAFNEGSVYQEGKYKETAQQPLSASWSKNSTNDSPIETPNVTEIFKPNYGELENVNIRLEVIVSEPVVDEDGTMYVGTRAYVADSTASIYVLYAVSPDGKVKWHIKTAKLVKGMAIHSNGNLIYNDGTVNMVNAATGEKIWSYQKSSSDTYNYKAGFMGSPVIDDKGNIIILHNDGIFALTSNGTLIDSQKLSSVHISDNEPIKGPQIRNDGTIFVINSGRIDSFSFQNNDFTTKYEYYSKSSNGMVLKDSFTLTTDGKVAYAFAGFGTTQIVNPETKETTDISAGKGRFWIEPTVYSKDGSILYPIYEEAQTLNKYDKEGGLIWSYNSRLIQSSPVIDSSGNIIFVEQQDSSNTYLTSLKQDKTPNWSVKIPGKATSNRTQPIILKDKGILVAMDSGIVKVGGQEENTNDDQSTPNPPETEPIPDPEEKSETKLITVFDETNKYDTSSFNDKSEYTVYEYTEKKDDWYKIITAPNHTKWINSTNTIEGEINNSEQTVSVTRDSFGYTKPFFHSKKTDDILKKGSEVKVYGEIGDWYLIKVDGKDVWFNQKEIKLTTFVGNKLYREPDLNTWTSGIASPQTLNVKDILITTNTDYWYKVQSWLGDVYTLGEQSGFGSIQTFTQSYNAKDIKGYDTPFSETSTKTLNGEVTLVGKWQDWYKTSENIWIKIQ
ncbi:PQQ-binding-like beta-propeller repeat protein [Priestia megaterium]|uniref:outer membrane protein assembly factor BamB family protein n=1 Tax=Priestia megaterium TaxID=1404 RepID=UPI002E243C0A|nr:PQQ-binding-like beta-propeller repeat protein [Priestia megaterium]